MPHIGNARCIPIRAIQGCEPAAIEHKVHIGNVRCIPIRASQGSKIKAVIEHTVHIGNVSRIEIG